MAIVRGMTVAAALVLALTLAGCTGPAPAPVRTDTVRIGDVTATSGVHRTNDTGATITPALTVVDAGTVVVRQRNMHNERWWALNSATLKLVSTGTYKVPASHTGMGYLAATEESAAVWWVGYGYINGTVYKAHNVSEQTRME